ncbi:GYD domain superfamily [Archaeoglobales archaeon]|nr:MAG: GYD domain superfamily [Archaeoglobales archaeon]
MAIYIVLSKLTDDGAETIVEKPDRIKEVNKELEKQGLKVLQQYLVFGEYDFVNIVEAEDNKTVAKALLNLASRGTIRTVTLPAIPVDEIIEELKS